MSSSHATEKQIPLALIGLGLVLYVVAAFTHAGAGGVAPVLVAVMIGGMIQTVLLIAAAFLVAMVLNVSFGDLGPAALKFAGATLAAGGIAAVLPAGGLIGSIAFLAFILWLFELELPYAVALAVMYWALSLVVASVIVAALR